MRRLINRNKFYLGISAVCLLVTSYSAFADEALSDEQYAKAYGNPARVSQDKKSPTRFWDGSFDRAADSTHQVETNNKISNENCNALALQAGAGQVALTEEEAAVYAKCQEAARKVKYVVQEAKKIKNEQRIMAEASRLSDAAAIAAVGTVAVTQMTMAKSNQASSLSSAASMQKTAGYVNYTTGVADLGLGAYAYASQKSRLEKLKKMVGGDSSISGIVDQKMVGDLQNSIDATKSAATSHLLYGTGKVAAGYLSMKLAESNEAAAESLSSLPIVVSATGTTTTTTAVQPSATVPFSSNSVAIDDGSGTSTVVTESTDTSGGSGSSVLPGSENRGLATLDKKENKASTTAASPAAPAASKDSKQEDILNANELKSGALLNPNNAGTEVVIGQGGGNRWGGGGTSKPGTHDDMPSLGFFGGPGDKSAATGVDPTELFNSATEDSQASASKSGRSLFDIVKTKYHKAMSSGMVAGPTFVEIRN